MMDNVQYVPCKSILPYTPIRRQQLFGVALVASSLMHGLLFFILSHDGYIQPLKPITIELDYSQKEIQTVKPQTNTLLAPPTITEKKPDVSEPVPLVTPLVAQESTTPEANPIVVPSVEPSQVIAPPSVVEKPIKGEGGGTGITEQSSEKIVADISDLDEPIRVIKCVKVDYPPLVCKGINGLILLKILVDGDGNPVRIEVVQDDLKQFPSFSENALKSVRKWRFSKPMIHNAPVCVWYILPVRFR